VQLLRQLQHLVLAAVVGVACAGLGPGTTTFEPVRTPLPGASPSPAASSSTLVRSLPTHGPPANPIPLPDPVDGLPIHGQGEPVRVGDVELVYAGIERHSDGAYAVFDTGGADLDAARLLIGDTIRPLEPVGGRYEAGPLPVTGIAEQLTVVVGENLIVFRTGKVKPADR
jgi:hypothetical protein